MTSFLPPSGHLTLRYAFRAVGCLMRLFVYILCIQVRELKTKVEKVKKRGEPVPFVMVDLKKYAPLLFV